MECAHFLTAIYPSLNEQKNIYLQLRSHDIEA